MTNYEITYIINPSLDEAAKNELVERFDNILKNDGAEIVESKDWSASFCLRNWWFHRRCLPHRKHQS